jgi:hypothetical protein
VALTTEPLDTANIVDVPADLSTPFDYLTNSDRVPGPQVRLLAASVRDGCVPRECTDTHTRVGCRELAREWRVETDWEMKEVGDGGIEFSDEVVTFGDSEINT